MVEDSDNTVHLRGRVSGVGEERQLPSGDLVVTMRVVVPRRPRRSQGGAAAKDARTQVDTIDVACWSATTRRIAATLTTQDQVEVDGALRRRFFRAAGSAASRYEVEARAVRRMRS